ncbi:hypothetical protein PROAA_1950016 [Candidatus Propionivibrio aalborgensis]|uniref:Uncharacterized protein n=1 Tax=Candidatus Propionivibrio aalborgensis TaxID=1860101 RepID=A0A1A8XNF0_9RHOO|nr:hypothetical protein PROAA_1950016 [Candidatus Propionivibrio aalborgensis]
MPAISDSRMIPYRGALKVAVARVFGVFAVFAGGAILFSGSGTGLAASGELSAICVL